MRDRTPDDLAWELGELNQLLDRFEDLTARPSKMQQLAGVLQRRRIAGNRVRQVVVFTRFKDTLDDIVNRLRAIDTGLLIGTYSGQGGRYVDPRTRDWVGVERDEVKHRFIRGEIDILVCTDAADEGLNLQTADLLINYDLPWNPMNVEQRIGRIGPLRRWGALDADYTYKTGPLSSDRRGYERDPGGGLSGEAVPSEPLPFAEILRFRLVSPLVPTACAC